MTDSNVYSVSDLARHFNVHYSTVCQWVRRGHIRPMRENAKHKIFSAAAVRRLEKDRASGKVHHHLYRRRHVGLTYVTELIHQIHTKPQATRTDARKLFAALEKYAR